MRFGIWHKTGLLCAVMSPLCVWLMREDIVAEPVDSAQFCPYGTGQTQFRISNSDSPDELVGLFEAQLRRLMKREGLRGGVSVAISKGGRLVFAKGFGLSDVEDSVRMEPYNVLRVASVSKLITAVAIMRLVEQGRLTLDQKVFGPTGVLNDDIFSTMKDRRMGNVTIRNLLNHSGGWMTRYGDPMFMPQVVADEMGCGLPVSVEDIIRFMLGKSMHFQPGAYSVYSNFGYAILGEVVAKASGVPYEEYVRSEIMAPLGIYDAHLGYSRKEERLENEVLYYEQDTSFLTADYAQRGKMSRRAYGGSDIHTLGAAGGWVVSAPDLVKLALSIDGLGTVPDLLSRHLVDEMTVEDAKLDPLGWRRVVGGTWFRTGTLSASSAIVCRRPDGVCFAAILNSSNSRGPGLAVTLANVINQQIDKIVEWQAYDLWQGDERWQAYKLMN